MIRQRFVVDTNVVFEGLTKKGGAADFVVQAWLARLFRPYLSNALAYEYADVLSRKLSEQRWKTIQPVLGTMLARAEFVTIHYSWRPSSPDPGDEHIVDCVMNSGSILVTYNLRDFKPAQDALGLIIWTPVEFVTMLARSDL
jgi:predicted nucleic acid-binding protein